MAAPLASDPQAAAELAQRVCAEIEKALRGKPEVVRAAVETLVSGGHLLLEDVPGVGKTTLAQALARAIEADFRRIQFTSDLLPGDLLGGVVPDPHRPSGETLGFVPGPIFSQVVLADEINRASPKTQSALLEAMAEGAVTVEGERHALPEPFFVIATQNPFEHHGTYPLPESQLDRFQRRLHIGYPSRADEAAVLRGDDGSESARSVATVLGVEEVMALRAATLRVKLDDAILNYILDIVAATRSREGIAVGVSTRGAIALRRAAQARALLDGRDYCIPEDVRDTAPSVIGHRLVFELRATGRGGEDGVWTVVEILDTLPVPL